MQHLGKLKFSWKEKNRVKYTNQINFHLECKNIPISGSLYKKRTTVRTVSLFLRFNKKKRSWKKNKIYGEKCCKKIFKEICKKWKSFFYAIFHKCVPMQNFKKILYLFSSFFYQINLWYRG